MKKKKERGHDLINFIFENYAGERVRVFLDDVDDVFAALRMSQSDEFIEVMENLEEDEE